MIRSKGCSTHHSLYTDGQLCPIPREESASQHTEDNKIRLFKYDRTYCNITRNQTLYNIGKDHVIYFNCLLTFIFLLTSELITKTPKKIKLQNQFTAKVIISTNSEPVTNQNYSKQCSKTKTEPH